MLGGKQINVLYLFSGADRPSSLAAQLEAMGKKWGTQVNIEMVDIVRSEAHDLSKEEVRESFRRRLRAGEFEAVVITPPCSTWTRVRMANFRGPRPVRDMQHPWGFPWLSHHGKEEADLGSLLVLVLIDFVTLVGAHPVSRQGFRVVLFGEHPEDLGRVVREEDHAVMHPASIWQLDNLRELLLIEALQLFTLAFNQCCWGAPYRKPTRVITNIASIKSWGPLGWPLKDDENRYLGPLAACACKTNQQLVRTKQDKDFKTTGTSAYPPKMDQAIAQGIWEHLAKQAQLPPKDGDCSNGAGSASYVDLKHEVPQNAAVLQNEAVLKYDIPTVVDEVTEDVRVSKKVEAAHEEERSEGKGVPVLVYYKGKHRPINDGAGLCSPGRWRPSQRRRLKGDRAVQLAAKFRALFLKWVDVEDKKPGGAVAVFWKMAAGRSVRSPFEEFAGEARAEIDSFLVELGEDPTRRSSDRETEINMRRLMAVAACLGDEDFAYLDEMASRGVAIGVDVELPRVPKVFEEKTSWALEFEEAMWEDVVSDNYPSAKENEKDIKRQVMEEVEAGTIKRLGHKEAVKKFGGRLAVAALGAVPKELNSERVRLIHDGTYSVGVNQRIRVRDRLRFPLIEDAAAILREVKKEAEACRGLIRFSLLYDVSRAHKLVPVREEDWGLLAFKLPGDSGEDIYFHTRGTFGIGSAAYWWQRLASTVVRSAHRLGGDLLALWHLLFADDGWLTATGKMFWQKLLFWLFTLDCLELPLSWKKVAGGAVVQWIGYQLDVKDFKKGISQKKVEWINKWVKEKTAAGGITGRELRAALGRLSFVGGALQHVRPFLSPLFRWASVLGLSTFAPFPKAVAILLAYVCREVNKSPMRGVREYPLEIEDFFRIDAKAEQDKIVIGGWETLGNSCTQNARWFSVKLGRREVPWAYLKGEPFRSIATLELVGVLLAVMLFSKGEKWSVCRGAAVLPGLTDNQAITHVLRKFGSSSFPLSVVVMELACQLEANLELDLRWVPRLQNEEADALTNELFDGFSPENRIEVDFNKLPFVLLWELMDLAGELDEEVKMAKTSREAKGDRPDSTKKAKKKGEMKWKDPW